jgi:hypothetical protein
VLESGHTVRCTVDEALLGDGTTLGLELLSEDEIATVSLRQGDQTLDIRTVQLLQDLTGSLLPPPPAGTTPTTPSIPSLTP